MQYQLKTLDGLDENLAALYEETDGAYTLKIEGLDIPDTDGLKSALQKERDRAKQAEKALKDAEVQRKADADAAARKAGDIEAVEKNLHEHYKSELEQRDAVISRQGGKINEVLLRDGAFNLATKYAVDGESAGTLAEWIENRMEVSADGDDFKLQPKGEFAGLSMDQFEAKLPQQKGLARLLKASDGKGGGATNPAGAGSTNPIANLGGDKSQRLAAISAMMKAEN